MHLYFSTFLDFWLYLLVSNINMEITNLNTEYSTISQKVLSEVHKRLDSSTFITVQYILTKLTKNGNPQKLFLTRHCMVDKWTINIIHPVGFCFFIQKDFNILYNLTKLKFLNFYIIRKWSSEIWTGLNYAVQYSSVQYRKINIYLHNNYSWCTVKLKSTQLQGSSWVSKYLISKFF